MIAQGAEVTLGVGVEPGIHMLLDDLALDLQALPRHLQQAIQLRQQGRLVASVEVTQPRTVDRHHAQRTGLLGRAEQSAATLEQLAHVQLQAAAHGTHLVGLHIRVEEVLEVRQPVARGHLEQALGVVAVPGEVVGDVVGRDREGEHPAEAVAGLHDFDVGAVDQLHLGLQLAVGEGHFLAADVGDLLAQVFRANPVEGQVGERRLRAPARRHVEVVDELLDRLPHLVVTEPVLAHEGREVGIEAAERLGAGPLVLQRAEEVDHLPQGAGQVLRRARLDSPGNAVEPLVQQRAQRPAGAVAGEHVQVVDMQIAFAVRRADLRAVDLVQPVVGGDLARHVEDQPTQ